MNDLLTLTRCSVCEEFKDIGYNYLIDVYGNIYAGTEGRRPDTYEGLAGEKTFGEMTNRSRNMCKL